MMLSRDDGDKTKNGLHLLFTLAALVHSASCQCSGTTSVFTASNKYQVFTSLNYPFGYSNNQNCEWRIEAANITDAIRMEIIDAEIEYHADCVYDHGEVFDGYNVSADSLGKFCGTNDPSFVSKGNYMTVIFKSDYSLSSKGFKARYKSGPRSTLIDKEEDEKQVNMLAIVGASIGAVVFIIVIMTIVYTYIQAKKAKELRRNPHLHRGMARVEPFGYGGGWSYLDGPAPPAYGEIYSSPMSPPPRYSEIDPNPNPSERLPGRREYMADNQTDATVQIHSNQREGSDTNANTHFIMSNSVRNAIGNTNSAGRRSTTVSNSASNNSSLQTLNPALLNPTGSSSMAYDSNIGISLPGQTDSLPSAIAPISTTSVQTALVTSANSNQRNNLSTPHGRITPVALSPAAQNGRVTSPQQTLPDDGFVSPRQSVQDIDDNISVVSEMSLPPSPAHSRNQ